MVGHLQFGREWNHTATDSPGIRDVRRTSTHTEQLISEMSMRALHLKVVRTKQLDASRFRIRQCRDPKPGVHTLAASEILQAA